MKTVKAKAKIKVKRRRFLVIIRRTATGYSADAPDVLGCVAAAKTVNATRRLMTEALTLHFELMHESGEAIPEPRPTFELAVDEFSEEDFCTWVVVNVPEAASRKR
jgi:predicted RNase H-like HicB family nuclease